MYKIYADNTLIYDSTIEDYKIGKGSITLEVNKSGSFTFSLYPDHFYYDRFIRLKTVITVYKSDKIVFRGRILNDVTDYWNNKVITCEGELGFLQDSIIRPFTFSGTPEELFTKFIEEHNSQVDEFKRFKIGVVTVVDPNDYIARSNSGYESALSNLNSRLVDDSLGGYLYITHGEDDTDPIPTINYLADFTKVSEQSIEFGSNLKDYTKTVKAEEIATAIIPLGKEIDDGNEETENKKLTIKSVNNGLDYVFNASAVALYGWIFKVVEWNDVTVASNLKTKGEEELQKTINQNVTIDLTAIDLHLMDRSIESYKIGYYIPVSSDPHNFEATLLCKKQTLDLLKPDNDTITLGYTYSTFTEYANKSNAKNSNSLTVIKLETSKLIDSTKEEFNKKLDNTKTDLLNEIDSRDLEIQRLSSLMAQSFGVFKTEEVLEDGSTVYYMHDKQTLAKSTTIWKMTANAFAVSTDGGKTWKAGLDSSGNAVLNVLSIIGIKAEWLDVDNLSAISANIAGWSIDENGFYKEVQGATTSEVYRVYFQAPKKNYNSEVLTCRKSTDGGSTFTTQFALYADGSAKLGKVYIDTDGYFSIKMTDNLSLLIDDNSMTFYKQGSNLVRGFIIDNNGAVNLRVDNVVYDMISSQEGYTGDVELEDGTVFAINKGIITDIS